MSRDPYTTRDMVDDDLRELEQEAKEADATLAAAKVLVRVAIVFVRVMADLVDVRRTDQ